MASVTMSGRQAIFLTVLLLAALALVAPSALQAHFESGQYSHRQSDCASRSDPITVVFYKYGGADRVNNHVRYHTGWGGSSGGGQHFASHGTCGATNRHAESGTFTRFHIRMRTSYHTDATWGATTPATPHHEDWVSTCNYGLGGHAVDKGGVSQGLSSGFDQGRMRIVDAFLGKSGHTYAGSTNWGNTREFKQRDGDYAGSNGSVAWFRIPSNFH